MYIAAMTILRMELLIKWYRETNLEEMPQLLQVATSIFSVFILVGLGAWVMIRAMQDNPDELKQSKIKFVFTNAKSKLRKSLKKLAKAEAAVAAEEKLLAEISAQWDNRAARYPEVGESAKSAYRRALVNQAGTPEFTTTYLPKDKFSLRRPKRD
jgi:Tfp pilus assembly protein PilO